MGISLSCDRCHREVYDGSSSGSRFCKICVAKEEEFDKTIASLVFGFKTAGGIMVLAIAAALLILTIFYLVVEIR